MIKTGKENKVLSIIKESIIENYLKKGYLPLVIMDGSPESFVNFAACYLATAETKYYLARYSYIPIYKNMMFLSQYNVKSINAFAFKNINFLSQLEILIAKEKLLNIDPAKFNDYVVALMYTSNEKYKIVGNKCEDTFRCNLNPSPVDDFVRNNPLFFLSHGEVLQILFTIEGYKKHLNFTDYRDDYQKEIAHLGKDLITTIDKEGKYSYVGLLERFNRTLDKGITIPYIKDQKPRVYDAETLLKSDLIDKDDILNLMDLSNDEFQTIIIILETEKKLRACDPRMIFDHRAIIKDCLSD